MARQLCLAVALLLLSGLPESRAQSVSVFGGAGNGAEIVALSYRRDLPFAAQVPLGWQASAHLDVSAEAMWPHNQAQHGEALAAVGVMPMLRLQSGGEAWALFAEIGIGLFVLSHAQLGDRQLGSAFQFGEATNFGVRFGARKQFELSARLQHHSNAGIKQPNEGLSFTGVRAVYHFAAP